MAKFDLQKLDQDIQKLEELKELKRFLANPATASLLETYEIKGNGNGSNASAPQIAEEAQPAVRGEFTRAVEAACKHYNPGVEFTTKDIRQRVEASGYVINAKEKDVAVSGALKRLVARGIIEQTAPAYGQKPAKFRIPLRFPRE